MRKRKRKDTFINCYKFHCWFKERPEPAEDGRKRALPPALYEILKRQQELWNDFCRDAEERWEKWKEEHPGMRMQDWKKTDPEGYARYWHEQKSKQEELKQNSGLNWELGPDTLERFRAAYKRLSKGGGTPQPQSRLQNFSIMHRYTGGGVPIERLAGVRQQRFRMIFPPDHAYTNNTREMRRLRLTSAWFLVGEHSLRLNVIVHRPIPAGAILKRVALTGRKQSPVMPWQFWLVLTVEEPKPAVRTNARDPRVIGVDVGWWRIPDKSEIRIAMAWDGNQHRELLLPLSFHKKELGEVSLERITSLASQRDTVLETCKQKLAEILPEHPRIKNTLAWQRTRSGGLTRFLRELDSASPAAELLRVWKRDNDQLLRQQLLLENAFNRRRKWLYRNFAAELVQNYDVVGMEDLNLPKLYSRENQKGEEKRGLRRAAHRRKYAAIGELFDVIENAMAKAGGCVVRISPRDTTHTCARCGKPFDTGVSGRLGICPDGHLSDRDENASENIFSQTRRSLQQDSSLRKSASDREPQMLPGT